MMFPQRTLSSTQRHLLSSTVYRSSRRNRSTLKKILAANRGEIAVRILRAGNELGLRTVGIYSWEDRFTQHRYKADESYLLSRKKSPVAAYLDIPSVIQIAKENGVNGIHPGYGFLSENYQFAKECEKNGITFIGPTPQNLQMFGDKTLAREMAIKCKVPVTPGTPGPVSTFEEVKAFIDNGVGYPVIIKAALGGGGRGMRVVMEEKELKENLARAQHEALASFGDATVFVERYVHRPRHIEVQIMGDGKGEVLHFSHRDCSVQRRHQKVLECAPAIGLPKDTEAKILRDAVAITKAANYKNAGTVEFLVDEKGNHYFCEVNPRIQVEHTITEEITGVDLVQTQMNIAGGASFEDLGLSQDKIQVRGHAMQCRITTEDAARDFQPDSGVIQAFRAPTGMGIRIDDSPGFVGANITPHYDSLMLKITAKALERQQTINRLKRALTEMRVRGVTTNKSFLLNVLNHPEFIKGDVTTSFIAENPTLLAPSNSQNRGSKLLKYIANTIVNGPEKELGAVGPKPSVTDPIIPPTPSKKPEGKFLRNIYVEQGPKAFAKAVRKNKGLLLTDTTWRDAHQSLLATRLRTKDALAVADPTRYALRNAYSIENWGGATFDVLLRFLREDPWDRLALMREKVPDVCFQMLLRGANAVGYTSYPDNVVFKFCEQAQKTGMDVFRIFDSLNYIENMRLGIDAVGAANGIIEAAVCYSGDVSDPTKGPYTLDYYLNFTRKLVDLGIHVLCIKDMAGLLKPHAAKILVGAIRKEFPDLPIHIHTHDTAATGVASMLECAYAGADAVDVAVDSMSGLTSQPSMGAIVNALAGSKYDTGVSQEEIGPINEYWEQLRAVYAPFESGQKAGNADVYLHEMPGGQYTNLLFQSMQLGLTDQWPEIKKAYALANKLLGDIIKVTPSSKVVGDFAQFLVQNKLSEKDVLEKAESLSFPKSVVEFFQGYLGIPEFGFPEPLRTKILKGKTLPNGKSMFEGRPGAEMEPMDFEAVEKELKAKYGEDKIAFQDVMSHAMYPAVFDNYMKFTDEYGNLQNLDTRTMVSGMKVGQVIEVEIETGKVLFIKLIAVGEVNEKEGTRNVIFELNGRQRVIQVEDKSAATTKVVRKKADAGQLGSVGAPMPGVVVEVKVKNGQKIKKGEAIVVLSAMKMETVVTAPVSGTIKGVDVSVGDNMFGGDLLLEIEEAK